MAPIGPRNQVNSQKVGIGERGLILVEEDNKMIKDGVWVIEPEMEPSMSEIFSEDNGRPPKDGDRYLNNVFYGGCWFHELPK